MGEVTILLKNGGLSEERHCPFISIRQSRSKASVKKNCIPRPAKFLPASCQPQRGFRIGEGIPAICMDDPEILCSRHLELSGIVEEFSKILILSCTGRQHQ